MIGLLVLGALAMPSLSRDAYGVPHVKAASVDEAFVAAGYAVAQDRLWQMEKSRDLAEGRMAEFFGGQYAAADRETRLNGYTEEEIRRMYRHLSFPTRTALQCYANGVNLYLSEAKASDKLPKEFADASIDPRPWKVGDSCAIAIRLFQLFGRMTSGQLRDLALLEYLQGRKDSGAKALDIFDDLAWQNDPDAYTTLRPADDKRAHLKFPAFDRKTTQAHLAKLPATNVFELLPGISLSQRERSTLLAQNLGLPYKTGSYAIVIKGASGNTLLSAPQMGHTTPSIVHEIAISGPGYQVSGMDVPGVPGVLIGATPTFAWGFTTGVADTEDVEFFRLAKGGYQFGDKTLPFEEMASPIKAKGREDIPLTIRRTVHGPVVLETKSGYVFARHSATWLHELDDLDLAISLPRAKAESSLLGMVDHAVSNFNFFYAFRGGAIGWRYLGRIPERAPGLDPRLPVPGGPEYAWRRLIPAALLPQVRNPKSGLIANWNAKPADWWNNGATPVWGVPFSGDSLFERLHIRSNRVERTQGGAPFKTPSDPSKFVGAIAQEISEIDSSWSAFRGLTLPSMTALRGWDGHLTEGSAAPLIFSAWKDLLKKRLIEPVTGNFLSPDTFRTVVQDAVLLRTARGKCKAFPAASAAELEQAYRDAVASVGSRVYHPGVLRYGEDTAPYPNRGTYIQIVSYGKTGVRARNVAAPGVAESGDHSKDQIPLVRGWSFKPMVIPGSK